MLWHATRAASRHYSTRVQQLDLTGRQAMALLVLTETPGSTLGALAQKLGMDQPTASAIVDRLMTASLVRRDTDPTDRRRALLYATDKAMGLTTQIEQARQETEVFLMNALGAEKAEELRILLRELIDRVEAMPAAAVGDMAR